MTYYCLGRLFKSYLLGQTGLQVRGENLLRPQNAAAFDMVS